ncbi:hypothetical protein ACOMHN_043864 [Nucella lapillus]
MATARTPGSKHLLKVAVIGDKQVGKTSLIRRYVHDTFSPHYTYTLGGDLQKMDVIVNNVTVQVTLVDAAGSQYVRTLIKTLYRKVHALLVVFDLTRVTTFDSVPEWLEQIRLVNGSNPVIFLVGNKQDMTLYRSVPKEEAKIFSQLQGLEYYETSARTGRCVTQTFSRLVKTAWQRALPVGTSSVIRFDHISIARQTYQGKQLVLFHNVK